jgi:hypothetical protein
MLIHELAVWFGAWTKSKGRHEVECAMTGVGEQTARNGANNFAQLAEVEDQTPRDRANNFAQHRRLAHRRYQLWKRQQRAQRPEVVPKVAFHVTIAIKMSKQNDLSTRSIDRSRDGVPELSTIFDESQQNNGLEYSSTRQPTKA